MKEYVYKPSPRRKLLAIIGMVASFVIAIAPALFGAGNVIIDILPVLGWLALLAFFVIWMSREIRLSDNGIENVSLLGSTHLALDRISGWRVIRKSTQLGVSYFLEVLPKSTNRAEIVFVPASIKIDLAFREWLSTYRNFTKSGQTGGPNSEEIPPLEMVENYFAQWGLQRPLPGELLSMAGAMGRKDKKEFGRTP